MILFGLLVSIKVVDMHRAVPIAQDLTLRLSIFALLLAQTS
tara:strand:- start:544 stop:666 length:123 start_codon:yes stop_codon:yes gene_type:complete